MLPKFFNTSLRRQAAQYTHTTPPSPSTLSLRSGGNYDCTALHCTALHCTNQEGCTSCFCRPRLSVIACTPSHHTATQQYSRSVSDRQHNTPSLHHHRHCAVG